MAGFEKDDITMLSDTNGQSSHGHVDSQFQKLAYRTRSASISIPMNTVESYENETILVDHTGPLRSERRTPFTQMSGPLYVGRKPENLFRPNQATAGCKTVEPLKGKFPSSNGKDPDDWPHDIYMGKNEHLLRSGQLGMYNDPYCTTCPTYYANLKAAQQKNSKGSSVFDTKFHNALYGDAKGWARRFYSFLQQYIPGVMNPHAKVVLQWNKFFVISVFVAIFLDPLFFFLLSVLKENKCIVINWTMTKTIVAFRSLTDLIYFFYMLLQFRLAFVAPVSTMFGTRELIDDPKKIALNYIRGFFFVDLFAVLPLPQVIILFFLPSYLASTGTNHAISLLQLAVLVQYIPRFYRCMPLLTGQSPIGFVFEWTNFVINPLTCMFFAHAVGSFWYLFGLQRVNQCLRDACRDTGTESCMKFIDCGHGNHFDDFRSSTNWNNWTDWIENENASACFTGDGFSYGMYTQAVNLATEQSIIIRYTYSLFWGFQQISTLAGNQVPSYFVWEILFTMAIIGMGLFLYALVIGNMQNFLQALGQRRLEMSLRRRDVDQWMSHLCLPDRLRSQVRQAEWFNSAGIGGVNGQLLLENLPEDLQRDIKRYLLKFVNKGRIFALMDEPVLDAVCERLRQKIHIRGSKILYQGGLIDKLVFIVRGKAESMGENGNVVTLSAGDVCGEELLSWCLEHSSVNKDERKIRIPGERLLSSRTVSCLTNVEAFSLRAADLEEVTSLYSRFLRNTRVQGAIRYESPYWRSRAAILIQVAWRYRRKQLNRANTSQSSHSSSTSHQGTSSMVPFHIDYGHHMKL